MRLKVVWVGKTRQDWIRTALDDYASRIKKYMPLELIEVREEKGAEAEHIRSLECEKLAKHIPKGGRLIVLDERGTSLTSAEFASLLGSYRDSGYSEVVFAIGGAYGFTPSFRSKGSKVVSLSPMTFTHQMVRVFLLEQIYRGFTILNGEPYHH